jgi:hypothetical protein
MKRHFQIKATRQVYPWVLLWNRCRWSHEDAGGADESQYLHLISMLLCAFTLEAFLNHLLRFKYPGDWRSFESESTPDEKLDEVARLLNLDPEKGVRPFQTFHDIFQFRNDLVHAKPVTLEDTFDFPIHEFLTGEETPPFPLTKWENSLTVDRATMFFEDTAAMMLVLYSHADLGEDPLGDSFSRTSWEGSL